MYAIKHLLHIDAPQETVYQNVSRIEGLKGWWTHHTSGSTELNGVITFEFPPHFMNKMQVIESRKNELVKWKCIEGESDWIGTEIRFHLDRVDDKTRLRFEHAKWPTHEDFFAHCSFSWGRYLESLRQLSQTGTGIPFRLLR